VDAVKEADRYVMCEYGGFPAVYDRRLGYYTDRRLWDQRIAEGREEWADHDFELGPADHWGTCHAVCRRCGERRRGVWVHTDRRGLNAMWCRPSLWQRFLHWAFLT
jgi:hypothetical protein